MVKTKLVDLLNEALRMEYSDIFLYPRQADMLRKSEKEIAERFERFGRMEVRHADNLAMQIMALGGTAKWDFTSLEAGESTSDMVLEHIELEKKAIDFYRRLIDLADKEGEDQLKLILKGIELEETNHYTELKKLLQTSRVK